MRTGHGRGLRTAPVVVGRRAVLLVWLSLVGAATGARIGAAGGRPPPKRQRLDAEAKIARLVEDLVSDVLRFVPGPPLLLWSTGDVQPVLVRAGDAAPELQTAANGLGPLASFEFFPQGDRALHVSNGGHASILNTLSMTPVHYLTDPRHREHYIYFARIFPSGDRVVTMGSDGLALVWSARSGDVLKGLTFWTFGTHGVARIFPDERRLVTGAAATDWGVAAVIWDIEEEVALHRLTQPYGDSVLVEVVAGGAKVITASRRIAFVWDAATGRLERQLPEASARISQVAPCSALSCSKLAPVVVGSSAGLMVWSGDVSRHILEVQYLYPEQRHILCLPSRRRIVVVRSEAADVVDVDTGQIVVQLEDAKDIGSVESAVASDNGDFVAVCGNRLESARPFPEDFVQVSFVMAWHIWTGQLLHKAERVVLPAARPPCVVALEPAVSMGDFLLARR